ncbi:hypothetical protein TNCV_3312871 [Trichonephila clavipes]|nr:hypothetical protein TNCV_3312871 [Trichonephila clavipes]
MVIDCCVEKDDETRGRINKGLRALISPTDDSFHKIIRRNLSATYGLTAYSSFPQNFLCHVHTLPSLASLSDWPSIHRLWDLLKYQIPPCHSIHHGLEVIVQDLWTNYRYLINSTFARIGA